MHTDGPFFTIEPALSVKDELRTMRLHKQRLETGWLQHPLLGHEAAQAYRYEAAQARLPQERPLQLLS